MFELKVLSQGLLDLANMAFTWTLLVIRAWCECLSLLGLLNLVLHLLSRYMALVVKVRIPIKKHHLAYS
jgi:hypothetical protein